MNKAPCCPLQLIPLFGGVDGEAGRGGLRFWRQHYRRQNWWRWSSFHRDPVKRAVLTLGDSPARHPLELAAPRAARVAGTAPLVLPATSSAFATIAHNANGCVLSTIADHAQRHAITPSSSHTSRHTATTCRTREFRATTHCSLPKPTQPRELATPKGPSVPASPEPPFFLRIIHNEHKKRLGRRSARIRFVNGGAI